MLVQHVEVSSSCSAWKETTEPAPRKFIASRQSGNLPKSGQIWAGPSESHLPLESLKMPVKQVLKEIMVLEYTWRKFQRGGEQEERTPCPLYQPCALQRPVLPNSASVDIAQQAVPVFVLSCVLHTFIHSREQR